MNIKGVIFDFNGTLLWDSEQHELAWRNFAHQLCNKVISEMEFQEHIHGHNNESIFEYLLGTSLPKDVLFELSKKKEELYRKICTEQLDFHLAPGAEEFLNYLKRNSIPCAIATASEKTNVDFYVNRLHLNQWFENDKIIYNDGSIKGKPAPDIYIKAALSINTAPYNCVVFEDAISGIKSAHAAGIGKIIAVVHESNQKSIVMMKEVNSTIQNFNDYLRSINHENI